MTIVYTSETGFTKRYAKILAQKTGLSLYTLGEAKKCLEKGSDIIYMGWLFANGIKEYKKAAKRYNIKACCAVGLCPTGCLLDEVRKANSLNKDFPLFTLQGGMDHSKLRGVNKFAINTLIKILSKKKDQSEEDKAKLELIKNGGDFVNEENLTSFIEWYKNGNFAC